MTRGRRTLPSMDVDLILHDVLDAIVDQGGDWNGIEARLRANWSGENLDDAAAYADSFSIVYREPGGPAFIVGMRDRVAARLEPEPARPRKRPWRRAS